ncbi:hypothetical protein Bca4012_025770 [Brassica carinata]
MVRFTNHNQIVVLAFDVKTEEFSEMPLPGEADDCSHSFRNFVVGDLSGRLFVIVATRSMKPVCSSKNGRRRNMMLYNFETDASRYLRIRGVNLSDGFEADTYVESFISPNSYGAEN